ncbi:DUF6492 family protein [Ruegeria sp. Alg231-54]|uniref:DUF6492 family protein n=1 Tax=Ruegeria sp. Alg231-54 TaxID=1922221 RepID=UPI000D55E101|nr:DUF6492 family protein [Ruegeria sp. Alg231-54]
MITFVTVVHHRDLALLALQAKSMAQFVDRETTSKIIVVVNDQKENHMRSGLEEMLPNYGSLSGIVTFLSGDDIFMKSWAGFPGLKSRYINRLQVHRHRGWRGNNGYRIQQAIKLASGRVSPTEQIVILDAKNLFVSPLTNRDFFGLENRPLTSFQPIVEGIHENWLAESLNVLSMNKRTSDIPETTKFVTPFPVTKEILSAVCRDVEAKSGALEVLFASRKRPSEFMLINAWAIDNFGSPRSVFGEEKRRHVGYWPDGGQVGFLEMMSAIDDPNTLTIAVHYKALKLLSNRELDRLALALEKKNIGSQAEILSLLNDVKS